MKNFDRIEQFLSGNMSVEEAAKFKAEMAKDEQLAAEVQLQAFEEGALDNLVQQQLRENIKNYRAKALAADEKNTPANRPAMYSRGILRRLVGIAAGVLLVLGAFYFLNRLGTTDYSRIAENRYHENPPSFLDARNGQTENPDPIKKSWLLALERGETEKLPEAVKFFSAISPTMPDYAEAQYCLGHAYFQQNQPARAVEQFSAYLDMAGADARTKEDAEFYLILALLADNQPEAARAQAERIAAKSNHRYRDIAQRLLSEIGH